jgi:BirA family biotin operon repressor/biotin-[acetyl-CoA-carboxylase] ligase
MNSPREWSLDTRHLGRRVLVYDSTDSTSTRCAEFASDERHHGLVVLAHTQTAGRGQHGRSWLCQPGAGLLLSVLLFPPRPLCRAPILTAWAAVSVCELIQQLSALDAHIKWPNDVLINGRKVCGILIEQNQGVVAGIGLNLNQTKEQFRAAGLTEAGSLQAFTGEQYDVENTARELIMQLDQRYQHLISGAIRGLESQWRHRLGLVGQVVRIEGPGANHTGWLRGLSFEAMVLETPGDEPLMLAPEQVKHVTILPS